MPRIAELEKVSGQMDMLWTNVFVRLRDTQIFKKNINLCTTFGLVQSISVLNLVWGRDFHSLSGEITDPVIEHFTLISRIQVYFLIP